MHTRHWVVCVAHSTTAAGEALADTLCLWLAVCTVGKLARQECMSGGSAQPTPHTVTQVPGVGSLASPPIRRSRRLDVHTRSHTKLGSVLSSSLLDVAGTSITVSVQVRSQR